MTIQALDCGFVHDNEPPTNIDTSLPAKATAPLYNYAASSLATTAHNDLDLLRASTWGQATKKTSNNSSEDGHDHTDNTSHAPASTSATKAVDPRNPVNTRLTTTAISTPSNDREGGHQYRTRSKTARGRRQSAEAEAATKKKNFPSLAPKRKPRRKRGTPQPS